MGLPTADNLKSLGFAKAGAPFVRVAAKAAVVTEELDFGYEGGPFLAQPTGAVVHNLTGNNCAQPNTSSTGAISQTHVLTGADCDQPNTSTSGPISFPGIDLTGNNCAQVNTSTSGAISQTHVLTGNDVAQPNTSTSGAVLLDVRGQDGYIAISVIIG